MTRLPEQFIGNTGKAVGSIEPGQDGGGAIARPIDGSIRLRHDGVGLSRDPFGFEITGFFLVDRSNHRPDCHLGHFVTIREDFLPKRIGKVADAQTGPASISASACNTVTPQCLTPF